MVFLDMSWPPNNTDLNNTYVFSVREGVGNEFKLRVIFPTENNAARLIYHLGLS